MLWSLPTWVWLIRSPIPSCPFSQMNLSKSVGAIKMAGLPCLLLFPTTLRACLARWLAGNSFQRYRALVYQSTVSSPNTRVSFLTCHYIAYRGYQVDRPMSRPPKPLTAALIAFLLCLAPSAPILSFGRPNCLPTFSQASLQRPSTHRSYLLLTAAMRSTIGRYMTEAWTTWRARVLELVPASRNTGYSRSAPAALKATKEATPA